MVTQNAERVSTGVAPQVALKTKPVPFAGQVGGKGLVLGVVVDVGGPPGAPLVLFWLLKLLVAPHPCLHVLRFAFLCIFHDFSGGTFSGYFWCRTSA